jgi:tetratricopeptide (TPR) repeat protein
LPYDENVRPIPRQATARPARSGLATLVATCGLAGLTVALAAAPAAPTAPDGRPPASQQGHKAAVAPAVPPAPTPPAPAPAPRESADVLVQRAAAEAYNLDHDEAVALLTRAEREYPSDASVQRSLATVTWLNLLFKRGAVLVDDYLGPVSRENVATAPPPPAAAGVFQAHITRAIALAEQRVAKAPNDVNAQYDLGAALGLQASYSATIEGRVMGAFSAARRAYNAHERVLALAPARKDAALIVGTYRYLVANLSMPVRWMAYVAGFGGGRELGLQMIEEAAAYHGESQTDARFALVLLYNRERHYDKAMACLRQLQEAYPRNRLLWLESGATLLRAGRAREADAALTDGLAKFAQDTRPRMAGEDGLWYYKRGAARVLLKRNAEAQADLTRVLSVEAQAWVRARAHLELGKLADLAGDRGRARAAYDEATRRATAAGDAAAVAEARRLKDAGYKG